MKIEYSDHIVITDSDVTSVSAEGIHYTGGFISFSECAENSEKAHGGSGRCVGERHADGTPMHMVFYTAPKTTHIQFPRPRGIKKLFSARNDDQRFRAFQKQIHMCGFRTMDMS